MVKILNAHRKTITALAGVAVLIATTELGADSHWTMYLIALLTAIGVYGVPNA